MSEQDRLSRAKRDFFTNPYFNVFVNVMREVAVKEVEGLRAAARAGDLGKIQYHTGLTDGIDRVITRLQNEQEDALSG